MTLKRRQILRAGVLAAGGATCLVAPAVAQSQPSLAWRLTSSFPKSLDILAGTAQVFAKYVGDATDNAFQIHVAAAGEIAPGHQALDAVTSGAAECAHTPAAFYVAKDPLFGCASGLPYMLNRRQQQTWWAQGGGAAVIGEGMKKFNAYSIPMGSFGAEIGGWFHKEIESSADFNGLKIRVGGLGGQILSRLGAQPQSLTRHEILPALENGTLDAVTFAGPCDDEKLGVARFAKLYYMPGWWNGSTTLQLMINLDAWTKLPKAYQSIVTQAASAADAWMLSRYNLLNPPALKRLLAAGVAIKAFPASVLEDCHKTANALYAEVAGQNPLFKKALEQMHALRGESLPWLQMSDYAMDTFMLTPRTKS